MCKFKQRRCALCQPLSIVLLAALLGTLPIFAAPPRVLDLSTYSGSPGDVVTIYGANFGSDPNPSVYFGPVRAVIKRASATSVKVVVPFGAAFGPVTVTFSNGLSAVSPFPFSPTFEGQGII